MENIAKLALSVVILALAAIPTWLYLVAQHFLQPEGFWQKLITVGLGLCFLGTLQVIFLIFAVAIILIFWLEC
jgi:hypothetical protein